VSRRVLSVCLAFALAASPAAHATSTAVAPAPTPAAPAPQSRPTPETNTTRELLTDAAIIALIVAASIAAYKATGRPCACPEDRMRNGRRCGNNSAYIKANGYRPLCQASDISFEMIKVYRATTAIPPVK